MDNRAELPPEEIARQSVDRFRAKAEKNSLTVNASMVGT